jgi:serine/threonine protein kinase
VVQARTFHFVREIASGGFGSVYLVETPRPDGSMRQVALKLLHAKWSENEEIASRMRDEARLLARVRHPNIVEVLDLTRIQGRSAIVMEYLEAVDLNDVTTWAAESQQRVPLKVALEMASLVASALDTAYNFAGPGQQPLRVIHRDIKPSNIMIDGNGRVKVLDFGTARAEFDARESKTQEMAFGSLEYMPPERLFFEPETSNSDVYSLAATLYELLALEKLGKARLRPADHDKFIRERFDDLLLRYPMPSEEVEDVLHELMLDMLAFDEADRPVAADVAARMKSFVATLSGRAIGPWSAEVIPPLFRKSLRTAQPSPDSLVGSTLSEDAVAPGMGAGRARLVPSEIFDDPSPLSPSIEPPRPPPSGADDWEGGETVRVSLDDLDPGNVAIDTEWVTEAPPASASGGGGGWWIAVVAGVAVLVVVVGVGAVGLLGLGGAAAWFAATSAPHPRPAPVPIEAPAPPPAPAPVAPDVVGARFVSHLPATKKISARCAAGTGEGTSEAVVAGDAPGDCTVTAIDAQRNRVSAVVKAAAVRTYECFEDGAETCR